LIFSRLPGNPSPAMASPADSNGPKQAGTPNEGGGSMKLRAMILAALIAVLFAPAAQAAAVVARVDKSSQTMTVYHHGKVIGQWPVSTARAGKVTPSGTWTAKSMKR
jgi:hypothetical protein